jgi:hypothetical protein
LIVVRASVIEALGVDDAGKVLRVGLDSYEVNGVSDLPLTFAEEDSDSWELCGRHDIILP